MPEQPSADEVPDEHFDAMSAVLESHAALLDEKADELIASGEISIRTRKGGGIPPLGRSRDVLALRREVVGELANWFVDIAGE